MAKSDKESITPTRGFKSGRQVQGERTTQVSIRKVINDETAQSEIFDGDEGPLSLEEMIMKLEGLVQAIESGEPGLEEAINLYEEGTKLGQACLERLSELEQRVTVIREQADGSLEQTPLNS